MSAKDPRRSKSTLNSKLDKQLVAYVAAATAASTGMLAATPSAQAKVVYTATNTAINSPTTIDLNHDGIPDFVIEYQELDKSIILAVGAKVSGNEMRIASGGAAAGFFGVPVGGGEKFAATNSYSWGLIMAVAGSYSTTWFFGPWANAKNRYLGFKFLINGQVHYGWARLSVGDYLHASGQVVLTGYAYETVPNKTIIEGHISGTSVGDLGSPDVLAPTGQSRSLGMLARGADGLALWRREEEIAAR